MRLTNLRVSAVSMMPEDLVKTVQPRHVADMMAWLRQPQHRGVLLDDYQVLPAALIREQERWNS